MRNSAPGRESARATCPALAAYAELSDLAALPEWQPYVQTRKVEFESRTGAFSVKDPFYEARIRAFHDELVTQLDFHRAAPEPLDPSLQMGRAQLAGAFRGLFGVPRKPQEHASLLVNLVDRAEYYVTVADPFLRQAIGAIEEAVFDGRLAVSDRQLVLLPGAFVHPEEASKCIGELVGAAKHRGIAPATLLDQLMRMEHQLRVRSRMRASQVYRVDAL